MKRSQIDSAIDGALELLRQHAFALPPFARWTPAQWAAKREAAAAMRGIGLGWDVTDFGRDDFARCGSVLFTLRNGTPDGSGTPYAEKIIIQRAATRQEIPLHYHMEKTEDIINRAGGILMLQLFCKAHDGGLDTQSEVRVRMDGEWRTFSPGAEVAVEAGASITLTPGLYHRFWAREDAGDLIAGEVSSLNEDKTDNYFLVQANRYAGIDEDTPARHVLCSDRL